MICKQQKHRETKNKTEKTASIRREYCLNSLPTDQRYNSHRNSVNKLKEKVNTVLCKLLLIMNEELKENKY